ncbi:hypothetical protein BTHI11S_03254 [Bosea thiooxidans]
MSYARHLMPQIGQYRPGVWYCTAFGGHGMNTTAIGGTVIAEAIRGDSDRFKLFAPLGLSWNGGPFGRPRCADLLELCGSRAARAPAIVKRRAAGPGQTARPAAA